LDTENTTRKMFHLTVSENPIPKARARVTKRGTYTPKRTRDYEKLVRDLAALTWRRLPLTGQIAITFRFYRANARRADWDNLGKEISDSLQGVVYIDDNQICDAVISKRIDRENPRVEITVEEINE